MLSKQEIQEAREKQVRKANELIQKSHFSLSTQQQKIILYLISQISPYDKEFKEYVFNIKDFCEICGLDDKSGGNYTDLKEQIKKNSGIIKLRLDEDLKPYLLQLRANYTQYDIIYTLSFKSKYSIRLYELIKSIHYDEASDYEKTYRLKEFKALLGADKYTKFSHFKDRVLETAVNEINLFSDKFIIYKTKRQGRSIEFITLYIHTKPIEERLEAGAEAEKRLNHSQLSLFDNMTEK